MIEVDGYTVIHAGDALIVTFPDGTAERLVAAGDAVSSTPPVHAQLVAYNAHDIDTFVAQYAPTCTVEGVGTTSALADEVPKYVSMFRDNPQLRASVRNRLIAGGWVADEEFVTGHTRGDFRAIALYEVRNAIITAVRFLP